MHRAGYVLAGGLSSRMGRDKALLPFEGNPLIVRVAQIVQEAAGSVTLVGGADRLRGLGFPTLEDTRSGRGPLGGIHTILAAPGPEWRLITACDMPFLNVGFLRSLFDVAEHGAVDAVMARNAQGRPEPLCAVYRTSCFPAVDAAIARGTLKITAALQPLRICMLDVPHAEWVANANTPSQWDRILKGEVPFD